MNEWQPAYGVGDLVEYTDHPDTNSSWVGRRGIVTHIGDVRDDEIPICLELQAWGGYAGDEFEMPDYDHVNRKSRFKLAQHIVLEGV